MVTAGTPPNPADDGGNRPIPDPTVLTTDALRREVATLDTLIGARIKAESDINVERFAGVRELLAVAERSRVEQKADTSKALEAALAAAKEAVSQQAAAFTAETAKTERNFSEQLKGLGDTLTTAIAGLAVQLADVKERQTRTESVKVGGQETRAGLYALAGFLGLVAFVALAVAGFALGQ